MPAGARTRTIGRWRWLGPAPALLHRSRPAAAELGPLGDAHALMADLDSDGGGGTAEHGGTSGDPVVSGHGEPFGRCSEMAFYVHPLMQDTNDQ